jgi:hypothetical protein
LLSVIDSSGCEEYMNKLNYIKLGRARNNFRTPQCWNAKDKSADMINPWRPT